MTNLNHEFALMISVNSYNSWLIKHGVELCTGELQSPESLIQAMLL